MAQHRTNFFSRRRLALLGACGLASAALPAWAAPVQAAAATIEPLRVVASFSILADMVREVGGPAVAVTALVGPDADAHVYTPSPADVKRVAGAQLLVFNGLGFEGWLQRLVKASGYRGKVLLASQGVKPLQEVALGGKDHGGHDHGSQDPHAWQNLSLGRQYVENIRAALVQALPAQAAAITQRARDYQAQLQALDTELRSGLAAVPQAQRRVITTHDAFAYLGANYGIEFLAAQGWNSGSEPSARDVAQLIRQIRTQRVRAVFMENISDPRLIERIAAEGKATVGGTLYSDALSSPSGPAATYLQMQRHNGTLLLKALRQPP